MDLEKAYDRVPRDMLWSVLREFGIDGQLLVAVKSLYKCPNVCVRVNGAKSKPFNVGVGLRQGCVLSPLIFITFMNWIDMRSRVGSGISIGGCRIGRLIFADDMVLLGSSEGDLRNALNGFAAECCKVGMRVSVAKTETLVLSRKSSKCTLRVSGTSLRQVEKFKYLGVVFTSDGRQEAELDARIAGDGAVMRQSQHSILRRGEVGKKG